MIDGDGAVTTQRELLTAWREDAGVLGLRGGVERPSLPVIGALAGRPLVTGAATVVVADGVAADPVTAAERIVRWA